MKQAFFLLLLGALVPGIVCAESPSWTYIEASYLEAEFDDDITESQTYDVGEPDGFEVAGSIALTKHFFADIHYAEAEDEDRLPGTITSVLNYTNIDVECDVERVRFGIGYNWAVAGTTDLYGHLGYEDWTIEVTAGTIRDFGDVKLDADDDGVIATVGLRSVLFEYLELHGEVGYSDVFAEVSYELGAYLIFAGHISLGGAYESVDEFESLRFTFRYQF